MKICPIALQICQNKLKILPNTKWTLSKWPKCFNIVPKWRNFAKSVHTAKGAKVLTVNKLSFDWPICLFAHERNYCCLVVCIMQQFFIMDSLTRRKLPNAYKSCPKMISLENWKFFTPLQNLPKNVGYLGQLVAAKGFKKFPKVQKIAKSGHTEFTDKHRQHNLRGS